MKTRIGQRFSKWTVTSESYSQRNSKNRLIHLVKAKCSCGLEKEVKVRCLLEGKSTGCRSCGKRFQRTSEQLKDTALNNIFIDYRDNAKVRGLTFLLTLNDVKELIFLNCFYCGSEPSNIKKNKSVSVHYNGIDRIDNLIGYVKSNCVPCCKVCNIMKRNYDSDFFIEHLNKIIANNKVENCISTKKLNFLHQRALAVAAQSHDIHTKVAALLIDPKTLAVSADGYNGFVRRAADSTLPTSRPEKYSYIVHAEANLICNAVRNGVKTGGKILYSTISPCTMCLRLLWQAGIQEFYFKEKYKDFDVCTNMLDLKVKLTENDGFFRMLVEPR